MRKVLALNSAVPVQDRRQSEFDDQLHTTSDPAPPPSNEPVSSQSQPPEFDFVDHRSTNESTMIKITDTTAALKKSACVFSFSASPSIADSGASDLELTPSPIGDNQAFTYGEASDEWLPPLPTMTEEEVAKLDQSHENVPLLPSEVVVSEKSASFCLLNVGQSAFLHSFNCQLNVCGFCFDQLLRRDNKKAAVVKQEKAAMHFELSNYRILERNGKKIALYDIQVKTTAKQWKVEKVFKDFEAYATKIAKVKGSDGSAIRLKAPSKGIFQSKLSKELLESQQEVLEKFLTDVFSNEPVLKHDATLAFFEIATNEAENGNEVDMGPKHRKMLPEDFTFDEEIGEGSFAKVFKVTHKQDGRFYAMKVLSKDKIVKKKEVKHIMAERNILKESINHPFLVTLIYAFQTQTKLYFALEFINGGELFFHIQRDKHFSLKRARFYAAEIASALCYLHSLKIIYRDLKPENILVRSDGHIVLTDFGLCKLGLHGSTYCGTPEYLAPEIIRKEEYTKTVDWWTLGSVLYEMLLGLPPWYSRDQDVMRRRIINENLTFTSKKSIQLTDETRDFLRKLLNKDKKMRLGNRDEDVKSHSFFASIDWKKLEAKEIEPPYKPMVSGPADTSNIDKQFKLAMVPGSVMDGAPMDANVKNDFMNFSVIPEGIMGGMR